MGRLLQIVGCALMLAACGAAMGRGTQADAEILAPIARVLVAVQQAVVPASSASPSPSPSASGVVLPSTTPTPKPLVTKRGGPVRFSLNGSATFASRGSSQTTGNGFVPTPTPTGSATPSPFLGSGQTTASTNQTNEGLGLFGEVTRRTAESSTDLKVPISFYTGGGAGGSILGQPQLLYSTAKYALGYGAQPTTVFAQLPSGGTIHSVYTIVPTRGGDTTIYQGPALGVYGEQLPIEGVRWRQSDGNSIYEGGLILADGPVTGDSRTFVFGDAVSAGTLTAIGEGAYQTRTGGDLDESGLSYQVRTDDGSGANYLTAIVRHIDNGFVSFGQGEIFGDQYFSLAYRRAIGADNFAISASTEHTGSTGGVNLVDRLANLTFSSPLRFGGVTFGLSAQVTGEPGALQSLNQATTQFSTQIFHGSLQLSNLLERTTGQDLATGNEGEIGYNTIFQLPLHGLVAGLSFNTLRLTSQFSGSSLDRNEGISLSRTFGRTGIELSDTFQRNLSAISDALTSNLQTSVSRQISPVLTVQAQFGVQSLKDKLNPATDGRTKTFAFEINAPFSYGNGLVSGKVDPNLPATIVGRVVTSSTANPTFAGFATGGLSNVEVILDDKTVQRTDVSGNFQFAFVTPGQHQLRIDNASLPRGVTVNIPVNTIQVQGGQTAQVSFVVGTFGGISGHVYGRDDTGTIVPLPNVLLRVDGATYSQTDQSGAYGFGQLQPGKHTVSVIENSVPAFATFDTANDKQTVTVQNGLYTTLDFTALPLGSIAGSILFGQDMGADAGTVVPNAYVVAEPGEHAAIVNDDGSFVIDDLPPGDYTVSVDPETIPEGLGTAPDSIAVTLQSQEHYQGAAFTVGHTEKKVTFSFVGGGVEAPSAPKTHLSESRLPLRGFAVVTVDAPKSAGHVTLEAFGETTTLDYDEKAQRWVGSLTVPTSAKAGTYSIAAKVAEGTQPTPATLVVDTKMPIAILQAQPPNAPVGSYVQVRARFLIDAHEGDRIEWADGQTTTLGKPVVGRIFTFSLRLSLRPLHGVLLTRGARLPISLM